MMMEMVCLQLMRLHAPGDNFALDTDNDGILDHLDPDDDGDGLLTIDEDLKSMVIHAMMIQTLMGRLII